MAARVSRDDDLAYGEYHGGPDEEPQDRGFFGDVYHRLRPRPAPGQEQVCASFTFSAMMIRVFMGTGAFVM